ncbi:ParB N-terminal domain-containing protein [Pseudophaeobacter sp.]|uniref:ParB N-terminal domain-containing protein n=1 Tax=Pseudophaeobacter sp. TaxID=1971739 RepID=UPI003263D689
MARKAPIKKPVAAVTEPRKTKLRGGPLAMAADGQVASMREEIDAARASIEQRFRDGELLLRLSPDQVTDEIGSDRLLERGTDEQFNDLCASIEARGQNLPIRIRPATADWHPDAAGRAKPADRFYMIAGRRRLAACKLLGIDVLAIVTAVTGGIDDLIERFEENTNRADLTGFERYQSIGQIALALPDKSQQAIADLIRVNRADVSIGVSVYELRNELVEFTDGAVKKLPMVKIRPLVKQVKDWLQAGRKTETAKPAKPKIQEYRGTSAVTAVTARQRGKKMVLEFDAGAGEADISAALQRFLQQYFSD